MRLFIYPYFHSQLAFRKKCIKENCISTNMFVMATPRRLRVFISRISVIRDELGLHAHISGVGWCTICMSLWSQPKTQVPQVVYTGTVSNRYRFRDLVQRTM